MKVRLGIGAAAIAALGFAQIVSAADRPSFQPGFYLGGQYTETTLKFTDMGTVKPGMLLVTGGYQFNPNLAVEMRIGGGLSAETLNVNVQGTPVQIDTKINSFSTLLLRASAPMGDGFNLYAVAGATGASIDFTGGGQTNTGYEHHFSVGAGAEFRFGEGYNSGVAVEFGRLMSGSGYDMDGFSVAFRHFFQ